MNIDVFFAGLMLICLDGQSQSSCLKGIYGGYPNTAWVVKADGHSKPCGWDSKEETELVLTFSPEFELRTPWYCHPADRTCLLPEGDICVYPIPQQPPQPVQYNDLELLPRLDQIDRRFKTISMDRLRDPYHVPTRIHFPNGYMIGSGPKWPIFEPPRTPTQWYRSDGSVGGSLPSELSDRLKVTYNNADEIWVSYCNNLKYPLVKLVLSENAKTDPKAKPTIVFQNRTKYDQDPIPDYVNEYDDLAYLLWYYRLGSWASDFGTCPKYTSVRKDAVLLRCVRQTFGKSCAYEPGAQRDSTFWPPVLGSH